MTEPPSGQWRNIVPTLSFYHLDQFAALLRNVSRDVCPHHLFEPRNLVQEEIGRSAEPTQIGHEALNVTLGHSLKLGLVVVDDGGEQPRSTLSETDRSAFR